MSVVSAWYSFSSFSDLGDESAIWTSPSNAQTSDNVRASNGKGGLPAPAPYTFNTLQCLNTGAVSELIGAVISGIEIGIEGYSSGTTTSTYAQLVIGGVASGSPVYYTSGWNTSNDAVALIGGAGNMFGLSSLQETQLTSNFGVNLSITATAVGGGPTYTAAAYLDHIKIRFYYEQRGSLIVF